MRLYLRLLALLRPYRAALGGGLLMTLLLAAATAGYAWVMGPLLQTLITAGQGAQAGDVPGVLALFGLSREAALWFLPVLLVGIALLRTGAMMLQSYLMLSVGQRVMADLRRTLYGRYISLPSSWMNRQHSGDLISRFGADVQAVEQGLTQALGSAVKDGAMLAALLTVCALLEWRLFLIAMAAMPLAALPLALYAKRVKRIADACQAKLGGLVSRVGEATANVRVVQAYCREEGELAAFGEAQGDYVRAMNRSYALRAAYSPVVEVIGLAGLCAALYFAGGAIARGTLSGETLLSFLAAMMLAYRPVKELSHAATQVMQGLAAGQRIFEVLDAPNELKEPAAPRAPSFARTLTFRGVGFSYGAEPVLRSIELSLEKGKVLALVGESGSGKSTAAALVLRFYDPTEGALLLDGVDLREFRLEDYRRLIAYVPQEPVLFAGSIRDNVACVREGASEEELMAALVASHSWEFVKELPGGLDAAVGERGAGLSGGQRQRLALARAFLADAPIVLLDEATSALDGASEGLVQEGLERLLANRTALVIAHRLSTISSADHIALLAGGAIAERGTHEELLSKGGRYSALWHAHTGAAA